MNCDHDENKPEDIDALLAAQHRTIEGCDVTGVDDDEPRVRKDSDHNKVGSQKCVGKRTKH